MEAEEHLFWVMRDWRHLSRVPTQTPEMCFEAIKKSSSALQLIKNPTQEMVDMAIAKDPNVIKWVPSELQNEAMWLSVVSKNGLLLMAAVTRDITAFLDRPPPPRKEPVGVTVDVIRTAVSQNCEALQWVPPTDENIAALQTLPVMAKLEAFEFVLDSKRQGFTPIHVLERFFNLEAVADFDVKPLLKLLVKRKNTPLLVRFLGARPFEPEEKKVWIRKSMNMVRGHKGMETGAVSSDFDGMLHALKTLLASDTARSILNELEDLNPSARSASNPSASGKTSLFSCSR